MRPVSSVVFAILLARYTERDALETPRSAAQGALLKAITGPSRLLAGWGRSFVSAPDIDPKVFQACTVTIDDLPVISEGTPVDPGSVVQIPFRSGLPQFPPITQLIEREIASFCKLVDNGVIKTENNVLRLDAVCAYLPGFCRLIDKAGYHYIRIYRINDFLAASGYWLMFFRSRMAAGQAGEVISSSLSSHQFRETITDQLFLTAQEEALDEVISGWVTLLDKRDKETEEHTLRVADLAVRLAAVLGADTDEVPEFDRVPAAKRHRDHRPDP